VVLLDDRGHVSRHFDVLLRHRGGQGDTQHLSGGHYGSAQSALNKKREKDIKKHHTLMFKNNISLNNERTYQGAEELRSNFHEVVARH